MRLLPGRRAVLVIAAVSLATTALGQGQQPSARIVAPEDGAVVDGPNVVIKMRVTGVELTPRRSRNAAHLLIHMDDSPPVRNYSDEITFQGVEAGSHVVRMELRRGDGSAFRPPVRTQVRFTVRSRQP